MVKPGANVFNISFNFRSKLMLNGYWTRLCYLSTSFKINFAIQLSVLNECRQKCSIWQIEGSFLWVCTVIDNENDVYNDPNSRGATSVASSEKFVVRALVGTVAHYTTSKKSPKVRCRMKFEFKYIYQEINCLKMLKSWFSISIYSIAFYASNRPKLYRLEF